MNLCKECEQLPKCDCCGKPIKATERMVFRQVGPGNYYGPPEFNQYFISSLANQNHGHGELK